MIEPARLQVLHDVPVSRADYVLYWMQQSQRASFNPALEYAIRQANDLDLPVAVAFGLTDDYPEANARHYRFMLEGLADVRDMLAKRRIRFVLRRADPPRVALALADRAALLVCDRGYTRHQKAWRETVAKRAPCRVVQVESDVVVPVEAVSDKREYAARTLRPKMHRLWDDYLTALSDAPVRRDSCGLPFESELDLSDPRAALRALKVDTSVTPVARFRGGNREARRRLAQFLRADFEGSAARRGDPAALQVSMLSPYLHFGQISPVEIALKALRAKNGSKADRDVLLEQLIVRRELAMNFVHFTPDYDSYSTLPRWARETLAAHRDDPREHVYTRDQFESARTHDDYWNAAMREMVHTGYMHNYMRLYWAKKILQWTNNPEYAFRTILHLNNKYFLDGRDPNSYANVAWIFGLHDRPWPERPVLGKIRYMARSGLDRKFSMAGYLRRVEELVATEERMRADDHERGTA